MYSKIVISQPSVETAPPSSPPPTPGVRTREEAGFSPSNDSPQAKRAGGSSSLITNYYQPSNLENSTNPTGQGSNPPPLPPSHLAEGGISELKGSLNSIFKNKPHKEILPAFEKLIGIVENQTDRIKYLEARNYELIQSITNFADILLIFF